MEGRRTEEGKEGNELDLHHLLPSLTRNESGSTTSRGIHKPAKITMCLGEWWMCVSGRRRGGSPSCKLSSSSPSLPPSPPFPILPSHLASRASSDLASSPSWIRFIEDDSTPQPLKIFLRGSWVEKAPKADGSRPPFAILLRGLNWESAAGIGGTRNYAAVYQEGAVFQLRAERFDGFAGEFVVARSRELETGSPENSS